MIKHEKELTSLGYRLIAGTDEAGRGAWAGPIVVACVILPTGYHNDAIKDSKTLNAQTRTRLYQTIISVALAYEIVVISNQDVDKLNPKQATRQAMQLCLIKLNPDFALIDFEKLLLPFPSRSLTKGDAISLSIASASILAKVTRDNIMRHWHQIYPHYNFDIHQGYGTKQHQLMLEKYGICPLHRRSYKPIKQRLICDSSSFIL